MDLRQLLENQSFPFLIGRLGCVKFVWIHFSYAAVWRVSTGRAGSVSAGALTGSWLEGASGEGSNKAARPRLVASVRSSGTCWPAQKNAIGRPLEMVSFNTAPKLSVSSIRVKMERDGLKAWYAADMRARS